MSRRYQRLLELESQMKSAFLVIMDALEEIRQGRLYQEIDYDSMDDYINGQWSMLTCERGDAWAKQMRASVKMALRVSEEFGERLGNEAAARALRTVAHRSEHLLESVVKIAARHARAAGDDLTGKYVNAAINTLADMANTGGFVDTGNGTMTAFDAAVQADVQEAKARESVYRGNGWSAPVVIDYNPYSYALSVKDLFPLSDICQIEIKWRVVERSKSC